MGSEARKDNADLDVDHRFPNSKVDTDFYISEQGDPPAGSKASHGLSRSRGSDVSPEALRAKLGLQGHPPNIQNLDPPVIGHGSHILVTHFPQHYFRQTLTRTRAAKRSSRQATDRDQNATEEVKLSSESKPGTRTKSDARRVLPLVLMDLLPGGNADHHLEAAIQGAKRNSMVMQSTRLTMIQEDNQKSGRQTELRNQLPKWRFEEG